jgi:hypothetical protein
MPRPPPSSPPSVLADDYIPPEDNYPPVPDKADNTIRLMLSAVWQISNPREYQFKAIFYLVFLHLRMLYLIRMTAEGKSLVLLGRIIALKAITLMKRRGVIRDSRGCLAMVWEAMMDAVMVEY